MVAVHRVPLVAQNCHTICVPILAAACGVPDGFCSSRPGQMLQMLSADTLGQWHCSAIAGPCLSHYFFAVAIWRYIFADHCMLVQSFSTPA